MSLTNQNTQPRASQARGPPAVEARKAGWLLIAGAILAWIGAFSPLVLGRGGDSDGSYEQLLPFIATHHVGWLVMNGGFLAGTVLTLLGFAALSLVLQSAGDHLPRLAYPIAECRGFRKKSFGLEWRERRG